MKLDAELKQIEAMNEDYPGQKREIIRQKIIESAFGSANEIIHEYTDGESEYRYVLGKMIEKYTEKLNAGLSGDLLREDLLNRNGTK